MKSEKSEYECPLCGEMLYKNLEGKMTFANNRLQADVYFCEECDQSFGLDLGHMKLLPYNSEMNKIENKCKICNIIKNFNQHGIFLLNEKTAYYEFHCFDCAKKVLQKWVNTTQKEKIKITDENIEQISNIYDFHKNTELIDEMKKHPENFEELKNKILGELE